MTVLGLVLLAVALLEMFFNSSALKIDVADGGYVDLLVGVQQDIPENETIISNLKVLLESSSKFLHVATEGRVFIKNVTLLRPKKWKRRKEVTEVPNQCFTKSDVRVELPQTDKEADSFAAKQRRPCGKRGDFIRIFTNVLADLNSGRDSLDGAAYRFVQEWAHFRYGVYYEYGRFGHEKYPASYCPRFPKGLPISWNSCSENINITYINTTCTFYKDCYATEDCKLQYGLPRGKPVESSIMFLPRLKGITRFCSSKNESHRHNQEAPNMQNEICGGESTWDIIMQNKDFLHIPPPTMSKTIQVTFREIQDDSGFGKIVVLVLDVSDSMSMHYRLETVKKAVDGFLLCSVDRLLKLGVVSFGEIAMEQHRMDAVNDRTITAFRDAVKNMPMMYTTCIGCGLQHALKMLASTPGAVASTIVLLTDGLENEAPSIKDVMPEVLAAKVKVVTMALGEEAEEKLEQLAADTEGKHYFFPDRPESTSEAYIKSANSQAHKFLPHQSELSIPYEAAKKDASEPVDATATSYGETMRRTAAFKSDMWMFRREDTNKLDNLVDISQSANTRCIHDAGYDSNIRMQMAFLDALDYEINNPLKPIYVMSKVKRFWGILREAFILDHDLGNNTVVTVSCASPENCSFTTWLRDPTGRRCRNCKVDGSEQMKTVTIPSPAKAGTWTLHVLTSSKTPVIVSMLVMSQVREVNSKPIVAVVEMSEEEISEPKDAVILVDVTKGENVVLDASVTAVVINRKGFKCPVPLWDNGDDPDIMKHDGTYSGYFTNFMGPGRYSLMAYISGNNKTSQAYRRMGFPPDATVLDGNRKRLLSKELPMRRAPADYKFKDTLLGDMEPTHPFQRVAISGSFKVTRDLKQTDVPPSKIRDFRVTDGHVEADGTPIVRLQWTWPGSHMTHGVAQAVQIRGGPQGDNLPADFESYEVITNVVRGDLDPRPGGSKHDVSIALPREWAMTSAGDEGFKLKAFLVARVTNAYGLKSEPSRKAFAEFSTLNPTAQSRTTAGGTTPQRRTHAELGPVSETTPLTRTTAEMDDPIKNEEPSVISWMLLALVAVLALMSIIILLLLRRHSGSFSGNQSTMMKAGQLTTTN
ncbi:calcium-activated chloride channel regulator 1-like [Dermacentor albipictus]|uniref:calcium-activated chloride channel regulator 1-like n=1 Tax=Dermacentor albipictus TaxID=60249 RepID=UPI0038FBFB92